MRDVDDEDEEETYVPPPQPSKEIVDSDRKSRKEREEKLRRMMEEEDDEEAEIAEEPKQEPVETEKSVEAEKEEKSVVSGGRRRGRRRIMKKKTVKDAEGYLGMSSVLLQHKFWVLTRNSDERGTSLGILLRGRCSSTKSQGLSSFSRQVQEIDCKSRTREYHVFLWEEVTFLLRLR
jgi:DNA polymerase subunit Cdc27